MRITTQKGVCYFVIHPQEKSLIHPLFFNNKTFLHSKDTLEVWGYNYSIPSLIISNQVYFEALAQRDFYSENKQEIFEELGLIENSSGVFYKELYTGKTISDIVKSNGEIVGYGFLELGDIIGKDKIFSLNIGYNVKENSFRGTYGI